MSKVSFLSGALSIVYVLGVILTSFPTRRLFEAALIRRLYTIKSTSYGKINRGKTKRGYIRPDLGEPVKVPREANQELSQLYDRLDDSRWQRVRKNIGALK